jgi:hypothetical protein
MMALMEEVDSKIRAPPARNILVDSRAQVVRRALRQDWLFQLELRTSGLVCGCSSVLHSDLGPSADSPVDSGSVSAGAPVVSSRNNSS